MEREFEFAYWMSIFSGFAKSKVSITPYVPVLRRSPARTLEVGSSWKGIEQVLSDIIERFQVKTERCLEFGVEYGFSTVALSSYFDSVTGVDTFLGDRHTNNIQDIYKETVSRLAPFENVKVVRSDYRDYIKKEQRSFGLIHVDIIHTFADTFACGLWSANHSDCTIFHDTESFPQVKQAVMEIARRTGKKFYNYEEHYGLGILV